MDRRRILYRAYSPQVDDGPVPRLLFDAPMALGTKLQSLTHSGHVDDEQRLVGCKLSRMELWIPWIGIGGVVLLACSILASRLFLRRPPLHPALTKGALCISILLLALSGFFAFLEDAKRNSELIVSPNGKLVARVMIGAGTPVDPYNARVIVRRRESLLWQTAYSGGGYFQEAGPAEPCVHWADDSHLIVDYQNLNIPTICSQPVDGVQIQCHEHNW